MRNISRIGSVLLLAGAVSCDTKVINPGPVNDVFLNERSAALAMVNGAGRALAQGINWIGYTGAAVSREIHPAGSTGSFGITQRWQTGDLTTDDNDISVHWEQAQRARWLAEETLRRMEAAGPPPATAPSADRIRRSRTCSSRFSTPASPTGCSAQNMCDV